MYRKPERGELCLCPYLLPSILLFNQHLKGNSFGDVYQVAVQLAVNNVIYSSLFKLSVRTGRHQLAWQVALSLIQCLFFGKNIYTFSLIFLHSVLLDKCFRLVPNWFPLSFTKCELIIICQGASTVIVQSVRCFLSIFVDNSSCCSKHLPTKIVEILYFGCAIILLFSYLLKRYTKLPKIVREYSSLAVGSLLTYVSLYGTIKSEPIIWLFEFLFRSDKSIYLMKVWSACLLACCSFAYLFAKYSKTSANTVIRKVYHVAIVIIFLTGAKYDLNLLYFTSCAALLIFVLLENVRIRRLPPLGALIDRVFKQFIDEKDSGLLTLTHIYLLVGFSLPIWIVPELQADLVFASGLITIGIGDTMASFVGYLFGRHRWRNSMKTYEGTAAAIVSQILGGLVFLYCLNLKINSLVAYKLIFISTVVGLIEAKTIQIDNLILPLYFHLIMLALDFVF